MLHAPVLLVSGPLPDPAIPKVLSGIACALSDTAHLLAVGLVDPCNSNALRHLDSYLHAHAPIGAILEPGLSGEGKLGKAIEATGASCVRMAPDASVEASKLVCSNDRLGICDATNYLISLDHRRIGFISISNDSPTARERELGFLDALAQHGLDFGAELIAPAEDTAESGREAALLLMAVSPSPTAILASSDMQAAGVMQAARLQGIAVPSALSVMGFGDADLAAALAPPLTTMRIPYAEMGFAAAIKLLDPARAEMQPVEFFCEVVVRESTAPPL